MLLNFREGAGTVGLLNNQSGMLIQQYTLDWVRWFGSGWRDDGPSGYQVRETLCYFMDFNLTRLPLLSGLILRTPSSAFDGLPVRRP